MSIKLLSIRYWILGTLLVAPRVAAAETLSPDEMALARYQDCFQKMIDAQATDNSFMRKCLGIEDKAEPPKNPETGEAAFLSRADVEKGVKSQLPTLTECYAKFLVQSKTLGLSPSGALDIVLSIQPDGKVGAAQFEPGPLADIAFLTCEKTQLKAWTFPKTAAAAPLGVKVKIEFGLQAEKPSVGLKKGSVRLSGPGYDLSPADIQVVFRKNAYAIRLCYDDLAKRQAGATGTVNVDLKVNSKGRVARATYPQFTVGDNDFRACLTKQFGAWKFPRPRSGDATVIHYPLKFQPPAAP